MLYLSQAIVVEGKYDRIRLSSVVDSVIVETGGFRIFNDEPTVKMLRLLAKKCGIIIMTDSDFAGFRIRNYLKKRLSCGNVFDAYLPDVPGKEKRKATASKEGLLGVEGFSEAEITAALVRAGVTGCQKKDAPYEKITPYDLYALGLSGCTGSTEKRAALLSRLSLPAHLSTSSLIAVLNSLIKKDELYALIKKADD